MLRKLILALIASLTPLTVRAQDVKPDMLEKITKALPDSAPAKPARSRKVLVYTMATGFVHSSIPVGARTFELLGTKTGAYETVISNDMEMFAPEKLSDFDCVVLMSTTGDLFLPKDTNKLPRDQQEKAKARQKVLRQSLLDFVNGGKGLVGIHAAADSSYDWKEFGTLLGGYFNGHPWGKIVMRNEDPTNPVNACFEGKEFSISDEIYTFRETYSRERLHILTSIDIEKSGLKSGFNRQDKDYGVSWLHASGKGRVFYCSLGHNEATYWNPTVLKHYLAGIQYALGDLEANDKPSANK